MKICRPTDDQSKYPSNTNSLSPAIGDTLQSHDTLSKLWVPDSLFVELNVTAYGLLILPPV